MSVKVINYARLTKGGLSVSVLAVSAALGWSVPAQAQTTASDAASPSAPTAAPDADIVVSGIRGSIIQGLESKRQSDVIVESIKSEDIGKFPDKNLAEALQRVPGLSIDRDGGEGRFVTIRGLGPGFNTVLLNGRRIASENYNRSFSFDTISSDLVGGINVYKTQQSYIREGGIGGTVDVRTARPMDQKGFRLSARVEGLYEGNSKKVTPNGSVLVSDTFFNDTVGVLFSVSRQERRNRTYTADTSALRTVGAFTASDPKAYPNLFAYDNFGVNPVYRPQELNRSVIDEHRVRTGFNGALQFKPSDRLEVNVDYLYSDFDVDSTTNTVSNWLYAVNPPKSAANAVAAQGGDAVGFANYIRNNSKTTVDKNGVVTGMDINPNAGSQAFNTILSHRPTVTQMGGINVAYKLTDRLSLKLDGAWSQAKLTNPGLNQRRSMEIINQGQYFVDATGAVPKVTDVSPGLDGSYDNAQNILVRKQYDFGDNITARNREFSAELNWKTNDDFKVRLGFLREIGEKSLDRYATADDLQNYVYQNSGYAFANVGELKSVTKGILSPASSLFGQTGAANNNTFLINVPAYDAYMANPANIARLRQISAALPNAAIRQTAIDEFIANGSSFAAVRTGESSRVKETVNSAYFDVDGDFELFGHSSHITAGVRYTHTDIAASGFARVLLTLRKPIATPGAPLPAPTALEGVYADANGPGGLTTLSLSNTYDNFLPSMNFKTEVLDNLIFRFAASQSMTRPELDNVTPVFTYGGFSTNGSFATTNNEQLRPLISNNLDASLEWYPARATSFAVDIFQKSLNGFIVNETVPGQKISTLPTTASGDYIPAYNNFTITRPANAGDVRIRGVTVSWTQSFAFGGGIQANYTLVRSNKPFDPSTYDPTQVTLPGLGNSFNIIGFYEKGPIAARIAYNKRDGFLRNPSFCGGIYCSTSEPVFAKSYDQLDARFSLALTKHIQVYVEGINLMNSSLYQNGRYDNLFVSYENFGRRYTFGATARF